MQQHAGAAAVVRHSVALCFLAAILFAAPQAAARDVEDGDGAAVEVAVPDVADDLVGAIAAAVHGGVPGHGENAEVTRRRAPPPFHLRHEAATGERMRPGHAHRYNSDPGVAALQRTAPPLVRFKRRNFGLATTVTDLVNVTFAVRGRAAGDVLVGLFGDAWPQGAQHVLRLVRSGVLVGSRCVRLVPGFAAQCGDRGDPADFTFASETRRSEAPLDGDDVVLPVGRAAPLRHRAGTISLLVGPSGRAGSHFVLSASHEARRFDNASAALGTEAAAAGWRLAPVGVVLAGYTTTLAEALLRYIPMDADRRGPRSPFAVTIARAVSRPFPRGAVLETDARDVGDEQTSRAEEAAASGDPISGAAGGRSREALPVPLLDVPSHVQARYYLSSPGGTATAGAAPPNKDEQADAYAERRRRTDAAGHRVALDASRSNAATQGRRSDASPRGTASHTAKGADRLDDAPRPRFARRRSGSRSHPARSLDLTDGPGSLERTVAPTREDAAADEAGAAP